MRGPLLVVLVALSVVPIAARRRADGPARLKGDAPAILARVHEAVTAASAHLAAADRPAAAADLASAVAFCEGAASTGGRSVARLRRRLLVAWRAVENPRVSLRRARRLIHAAMAAMPAGSVLAAAAATPCQAAITIPAQGGTFAGTTSGIDTLSGSCGGTGSPETVYLWTPQSTGTADISTCGTATTFDSIVHVRQGGCTGAEVACNDDTAGCAISDGSSDHGSRVRMPVSAGTTYAIVVDGYNGRAGTYALTVTGPGICGNNLREASEQCDGTDRSRCLGSGCSASCTCLGPLPDMVPQIADVGVQLNTTVADGDVAEGCAEATSGVDLLRFSAISRNIGTADLALGNPGCPAPCTDHPLAVCANPRFICSPAAGHNHAHYVNYARYELLDASNQLVVAGHKQGFCLRDTNCAAPRYDCNNQGISAGCADTYGSTLGCQYLDVTGVPAGQYTLRVVIDPFNEIAELNESNNVTSVTVTIPGAGGSGGACGAVTPIAPAGGTFTGTTAGVSTLAGSCGSSGASPERIFQWTPTVSGQATIQTCGTGTSYDTVLYVRTGDCRSGSEIACSDDAPCAVSGSAIWGSKVTPTVTAGQTYFIVVDGYAGRSGTFALTVTPPGSTAARQGTCANPITVPATGGTVTGATSGASAQAGSCSSTTDAPEHVYAWRPSASGTATISSCGSGTTFDSVVYVRGGTCGGSELTCNDDTDGCAVADGTTRADHHGSRVTLPVTAGQTYYVFVDGYAGRSGSYALTFTAPAPCATGATAIPSGGGTVTGTTAGASGASGSCGGTTAPEKLFQWTPARSGTAVIQTCGAGTKYDTTLHVRRTSCTGTEVACNDDTTGCAVADGTTRADHHGSRVSMAVTAGETYFIFVDGYSNLSGPFSLSVTPP